MKKILFVITTLGGGGAERIVTYLSNWFSSIDDFQVSLLLLREEGNTYLKNLNEKVRVNNLKLKGRLRFNVLSIVKAILNEKPDICFIGLDGLNILLAPFLPILKISGINTIVRETNVLSRMWKTTFVNRLAYRIFYNRYDKVICQSKDMADDLIAVWKINPKRISIINNPIDIETIRSKSLEPVNDIFQINEPFFVAVGRLTYQKGFIRLIELIDLLRREKKFPYKLLILGDGDLRGQLEAEIKQANLDDTIFLLGRVENPYKIMRLAKGFILSSEFEGFPNVLLEAHALGIPVLSNNCPGGISEIIIDGENGIVADFNNTDDFKHKYEEFLSTNFNKEKIMNMTFKRYDSSVILPKYQHLFLQ